MLQSRGTGTRRSNACWTCKLRRKKCDEAQPSCLACVSRSITCHGYDLDRPQWMDSGVSEKAELDRIQYAVKENKRRQRKQLLQAQAEARRNTIANLTGQPGASTKSFHEAEMLDSQSLLSHPHRAEIICTSSSREASIPQYDSMSYGGYPAERLTNTPSPVIEAPGVSVMTPETAGLNSPPSLPTPSSSNFHFNHLREAELLMHYLDIVFALQFRFHNPSVRSGGRGWLLWLLTETKPLYHAALSLGALHQHSLLSRAERVLDETLIELNDHHNRAIQELQIFLQGEYDASNSQDRGRKRELQILACGVELVSFELFRGGINVWDPHLKALATLLNNIYKTAILTTAAAHSPRGLEDTAEHFLVGCVLWFDLIACASTGHGPRVTRESQEYLLKSGRIRLSNTIGCQAWVAVLIGEIARLQETSLADSLSTWQLVERGSPIRQELTQRISDLRREIDEAFSIMGQTQIVLDPSVHATAVTRAVTLVFAHAAQVYLNTAVIGAYPYNADICSHVKDTAKAIGEMRLISDSQAARSLVWPICIAGSMAEDPALQSYFRNLIEDLGEQAHDFGNSVTVLRILEKCWSHWRNVTPETTRRGYSWFTAMQETGQWVLLV